MRRASNRSAHQGLLLQPSLALSVRLDREYQRVPAAVSPNQADTDAPLRRLRPSNSPDPVTTRGRRCTTFWMAMMRMNHVLRSVPCENTRPGFYGRSLVRLLAAATAAFLLTGCSLAIPQNPFAQRNCSVPAYPISMPTPDLYQHTHQVPATCTTVDINQSDSGWSEAVNCGRCSHGGLDFQWRL